MSRYEERGEIGRGGMSVVRKGFDPILQRNTALKVLAVRPDANADAMRRRFLDEARITGQLEHPNIVPIHEYGSDDAGNDFISMKLVQGQTFLERIREAGPTRLEPDHLSESLGILLKVCDAIAYAHDLGVIHRDLKPSNIMVGAFGQVYVMDWGIALRRDAPIEPREREGEVNVLGTPTYVAPEQIDAPDEIDERADVYALGGCLYALLTGRAPHQGRTPMLRLMASMHGRIAPPEQIVEDARLPPALCRIAMRALRRHPEDRYPTVMDLRRDLQGFLHGSWHLPSRLVRAGELVVSEGDPGDEAFVIKQGTVAVRSEAQGHIRDLGPGDVFGELAILGAGLRTTSVRAGSDVELLVVTRDVLSEGLGLNSWMGMFVRALADRLAEVEGALANRS